MNNPKVSVIINCFNGQEHLKEAIDSVYAQDFDDWEIIFYDNASTDRSAEIASMYDEKLHYFKRENNVSLGEARKDAIRLAKGEWIAFLDTDDKWLPNKLSLQILAVDGSEFVLTYGGVSEIDDRGKLIRDVLPAHSSGYIFPQLLIDFDINMVTPLINRKFLIDNNLSFEPVIVASEEYNLFMRIAAKGKIHCASDVLGYYRVSDNSLTNKSISKWSFEREYTLKQLVQENPGIDIEYPLEFESAKDRAVYYEARYHMYRDDSSKASDCMSNIKNKSKVYYVLWLLSHIPYCWKLVHSNFLKGK
ncbi:glycosyltransferase [Vibrio neptunius]|nr:glycosyltransferase family 2 protein [Vibrio neptunius]QXX06779.1 glycosyltransferase [Vibrio neptunius]